VLYHSKVLDHRQLNPSEAGHGSRTRATEGNWKELKYQMKRPAD